MSARFVIDTPWVRRALWLCGVVGIALNGAAAALLARGGAWVQSACSVVFLAICAYVVWEARP